MRHDVTSVLGVIFPIIIRVHGELRARERKREKKIEECFLEIKSVHVRNGVRECVHVCVIERERIIVMIVRRLCNSNTSLSINLIAVSR